MRKQPIHADIVLAFSRLATCAEPSPSIGAVALFTLVNAGRQRPMGISQFRLGCDELIEQGILEKYRHPQSLQFVLRVTALALKARRANDCKNSAV